MSMVLVTGGSGFIGSHCILRLLEAGHQVRTTVRSLKREAEVRAMLTAAGTDAGGRLSFAVADLARDDGWREAVAECDRVLHVASPFPIAAPRHDDELIVPAREGTLRVLRAARDAGVGRVVLTSSFVAIGYGHSPRPTAFDETDWTDVDGRGASAYAKSKTLAERAAWDFIAREGGRLELSVVNPVGVFGPVLGSDLSTSIVVVQRLLNGAVPLCPRLHFGVVDVRDVADLHLRAMTDPVAAGERFIAAAGVGLWLRDVADILRRSTSSRRLPRRQMPDWLLGLASLRDPDLRQIRPQLGQIREATSEKAKRLLGWQPRSNEEAIVAAARSLQRLGLVA